MGNIARQVDPYNFTELALSSEQEVKIKRMSASTNSACVASTPSLKHRVGYGDEQKGMTTNTHGRVKARKGDHSEQGSSGKRESDVTTQGKVAGNEKMAIDKKGV